MYICMYKPRLTILKKNSNVTDTNVVTLLHGRAIKGNNAILKGLVP